MLRRVTFLALILVLGSCSKSSSNASAGERVPGSTESVAQTDAKLAYRHYLDLEMPAKSVKPRYERARELCLKNLQLNCIMLTASLNMGDASDIVPPSASLTVRLPHDSVAAFEENLLSPLPDEQTGDAILRAHSMTAEDLTKAITDVETRQRQLMDYRDRLTALAKRPDAKVEDLVKIESELSNVQSQLETIAAQKKALEERVATESLTIELHSQPGMGNSFGPIIQAWRQAGRVLGENTGSAIRFSIGAIPWLPIIALGLLFVRFTIRRWRR